VSIANLLITKDLCKRKGQSHSKELPTFRYPPIPTPSISRDIVVAKYVRSLAIAVSLRNERKVAFTCRLHVGLGVSMLSNRRNFGHSARTYLAQRDHHNISRCAPYLPSASRRAPVMRHTPGRRNLKESPVSHSVSIEALRFFICRM
jgi:hypothetical protein